MQPSTEELLRRLLAGIERELPRAIALRQRLHAHPELAHAEHQTADAVARELPVAPEPAAGTGLIARVGPAGGAPVAVRAELDGLPVQERTGAAFSAAGGVMHACGHDVHMAALTALARAAHELGDELPAALLTVFQPSEEAYPSGAGQLAAGELADIRPAAVVAAHVHPELPWGTAGVEAGTVNASCDYVEITIVGEPSHGAYPHRGRDPILAIAQVVVALHAQVARRIDPLYPAVLTVGVLEGGGAGNVIPESARALAALRAHREEDRLALRRLVEDVAAGVSAAHGCRAIVELAPGEPALENDPAIVSLARDLLPVADLAVGRGWRSCGSDDFAFYGALAPVAMAFVGLDGAEGFVARPLHHPELLPPDTAVGAVARAQAVLYLAAALATRGSSLGLQRRHRARNRAADSIGAVPDRLHFTESDEANALIASDPMALLVGFALDQQVSVQQAFLGPLRLRERIGAIDADTLAAAELEPAFREKPAIHRYPAKMAERVHDLAAYVRENYGGDAARVWTDAPDAAALRANLEALPGFGEMKVKSLGAVLARRFGVGAAEGLVPAHPTLGDVDSPQALLDYQAAKRAHKAEWSKLRA